MTAPSRVVIAAFDALAPEEQQEVAAIILRRTASAEDLPEEALTELAAELFRGYDAEESARAQR